MVGYEIFFDYVKLFSALVPRIKNYRSLAIIMLISRWADRTCFSEQSIIVFAREEACTNTGAVDSRSKTVPGLFRMPTQMNKLYPDWNFCLSRGISPPRTSPASRGCSRAIFCKISIQPCTIPHSFGKAVIARDGLNLRFRRSSLMSACITEKNSLNMLQRCRCL